MKFDIITLFPEVIDTYMKASILGRAQEDGKIEVVTHNLRNFAHDKHRTVDDTPYGGGAGMVLKVESIDEAVEFAREQFAQNLETSEKSQIAQIAKNLKNSDNAVNNAQIEINKSAQNSRVILLSAKGKRYTQQDAQRLAGYDQLIFICGRYEGVDERVAEHIVDEEISIGDFVLTGGELGAMVIVDSVARLVPGVLGNIESIVTESHTVAGQLEYPQYTKPAKYKDWEVPEVLLSGNHGAIDSWRQDNS